MRTYPLIDIRLITTPGLRTLGDDPLFLATVRQVIYPDWIERTEASGQQRSGVYYTTLEGTLYCLIAVGPDHPTLFRFDETQRLFHIVGYQRSAGTSHLLEQLPEHLISEVL